MLPTAPLPGGRTGAARPRHGAHMVPLPRTMTASSDMAGTYAPPAVHDPITTAIWGMPAADMRAWRAQPEDAHGMVKAPPSQAQLSRHTRGDA